MDSARLQTTSYGKERPYALGHNKESWKLNRRSVTVVN
jgi:peptidoglycan-associated lipoprotein